MSTQAALAEIIAEYHLPDTTILRQNLAALLNTLALYPEIAPNPTLYRAKLLTHDPFPTRPADLGLLLLAYQREITSSETMRILRTQVAKNRQNLTDKFGFIFQADRPGHFEYLNAAGQRCRYISGFVPVVPLRGRIDRRSRELFLKDKRCPFTMTHSQLEVDDRTPRVAAAKRGQAMPSLTLTLVRSGEAEKYFQPLSKIMNHEKSRICEGCVAGLPIRLPEAFADRAALYKQQWDPETCQGCFWYDYQRPEIAIGPVGLNLGDHATQTAQS
jgi:hypothetical protein